MERLPSLAVFMDTLEHGLRNLEHPACTPELAGRYCDEVTAWRRALGIRRLLLDADIDGFHHELLRSAFTRRTYLQRCKGAGYADHYTVASRTEPFFDALTAGGLACTKELAAMSPSQPRPDDEYPEDFTYARFLLDFVQAEGTHGEALEARLTQYEAALGDADEPRLALCRALLDRNAASFESAFDMLLELRAGEVARQRARFSLNPSVVTGEYVFIEGLALLRLAEGASLPTREEYPFCPALARVPMRQRFPDDGYPRGG